MPSNDPFLLSENYVSGQWNNNQGYADVSAKSIRSSILNTSQKNLILITAGDSNMASVGPSGFTPTNASVVDNFNIYDGANYAAIDPLLGQTLSPLGNGGIAARVADAVVTRATFPRVIVVPCAVGGSTTTMWAAGGVLYSRLNVVMARLAGRGITPSTTNVTFALVYQIGANEHGIAQATFQANVAQTIAKVKDAGFVGRVFIPQYTRNSGTDATIRAAQLALVDNVTYFDGGDIDAITATGANLQGDGVHLTAAGQALAGTAIESKMHASGSPF
jgi:lysophospholipase L1-like esterase